jgi:hypothetical protein
MALSEHLIIIVSIIVGLGLTDLLANLHCLIRDRKRVRWSALPLAWAFVAFLLVINFWWGVYLGVTGITRVTSAGAFLFLLALPMVLYLVCAGALPAAVPESGLDLRESYFDGRRYFFALLVLYLVTTAIVTYFASSKEEWTELQVMRATVIAIVVPLMWTRAVWYHWAAAVLVAASMLFRLFTQAVD